MLLQTMILTICNQSQCETLRQRENIAYYDNILEEKLTKKTINNSKNKSYSTEIVM